MSKEHQPFKIDAIVNNPLILEPVKRRAQEIGAGLALAEALEKANIATQIEGDTSRWENPGQGALFVGDHVTGLESILLFAILAAKGREDVYFTAKPYSNFNHLLAVLGVPEENHTIPFIPRNMARGRTGGPIQDRISRFVFKNDLLSEAEIQAQNRSSIQICALHLDEGHGVNIFPTGTTSKSEAIPWQRGVGEIIKSVSPNDRGSVIIVPYRLESPNKIEVLRSIGLSNLGIVPKEQSMTLRVGTQGTINELFPDGELSVDQLSSTEITAIIERTFKASLH